MHPLLWDVFGCVVWHAGREMGGKACRARTLHSRPEVQSKAWECSLAALSLALRGHNVDRCFWGIGPGGVGQSLFTAHLATLLGSLHSYLDTNIYYTDDELRKQADQLVGCVVVTGQEAVEASKGRMREDLFKKHISADPVPARMNYAIITKQVDQLFSYTSLYKHTI